jgi:multidrug efflux pump subunit AcrB
MTIEPTGDFNGLEDIASLSVRLDSDPPTTVYLRDIAKVSFGYAEPPEAPAFYNGKPAVVVGVSMIDQVDSRVFSKALKEVVQRFQNGLPWGFELSFITFQQNEIDGACSVSSTICGRPA